MPCFQVVGPKGIEPLSTVPETVVLSVELWTRRGKRGASRDGGKVAENGVGIKKRF